MAFCWHPRRFGNLALFDYKTIKTRTITPNNEPPHIINANQALPDSRYGISMIREQCGSRSHFNYEIAFPSIPPLLCHAPCQVAVSPARQLYTPTITRAKVRDYVKENPMAEAQVIWLL